jgi:hypothetical protein
MSSAGKTTVSTTVLTCPEAAVQVCWIAPETSPPAARAVVQQRAAIAVRTARTRSDFLIFMQRFLLKYIAVL